MTHPQSFLPLRIRRCLCVHSAERRGEETGQTPRGEGTWSHFRRPLALRSPPSRLGLPSSVDDVVGSVWPQRAISACSATELATASSQPFISSWRNKRDRSVFGGGSQPHTSLPGFCCCFCYPGNTGREDKGTPL